MAAPGGRSGDRRRVEAAAQAGRDLEAPLRQQALKGAVEQTFERRDRIGLRGERPRIGLRVCRRRRQGPPLGRAPERTVAGGDLRQAAHDGARSVRLLEGAEVMRRHVEVERRLDVRVELERIPVRPCAALGACDENRRGRQRARLNRQRPFGDFDPEPMQRPASGQLPGARQLILQVAREGGKGWRGNRPGARMRSFENRDAEIASAIDDATRLDHRMAERLNPPAWPGDALGRCGPDAGPGRR